MLSRQGYASASLASEDEKDLEALGLLFGLVFPDGDIANIMRPDFLRLVTIIRICKFKISTSLAPNVINMGVKTLFN